LHTKANSHHHCSLKHWSRMRWVKMKKFIKKSKLISKTEKSQKWIFEPF
jgi:hypothetical protein